MTAFSPWQRRIYDAAATALAEGRLGHALLFSGPALMGKGEVAAALAQRMLCATPGADGHACGRCRGCQLFAAGTHPDLRHVSFEVNERTGKLRTDILVEQMRELGAWFALTPQMGGAQVALITPAQALTTSAANALLKTLEEPARDRYLLLVTDQPGRLPATIRSRCQQLEFRPPAREESEAWLRARGHSGAALAAALSAARGHPGLAADWLANGALPLREQVQADLNALAAGRAAPVELAQQWLADEQGGLRLRFAAELALDGLAHRLAGTASTGLAMPDDVMKLTAWFDALNRDRSQLDVPVLRHDLALAARLLEWRSMFREPERQGVRR